MINKAMFLIMTIVMVVFSAPLWSAGVLEDFSSGTGGFSETEAFSFSDGQFLFRGDGTDGAVILLWMGGVNSGDWNPNTSHSNYFKDFDVSIDMTWVGGLDNAGSGLSICVQENDLGELDYVGFYIEKNSYIIRTVKAGEAEILVDWTPSSHIQPDTNELSIFKMEDYLSFSINGEEVEKLTIEGCVGGGIGIDVSKSVDIAFDNFHIVPLVIENFSIDAGGFFGTEYFFASDGRFVFRGDGAEGIYSLVWAGGANPGGWSPDPDHSNYFEDFSVSVETLWEGGYAEGGYGLLVCNQEGSLGDSNILFLIDREGEDMFYKISRMENGEFENFVDWTASSLLKPGDSNELSILKTDNKFSFSINYEVVEELTLDECGGSIALTTLKVLDVSFDNFSLIDFATQDSSSSDTCEELPDAHFIVTPSSDLTVNLDASTSYACGQIEDYIWRTSDNQTASGEIVEMTFDEPGTYTIELVVTDGKGVSSEQFSRTEVIPPTDDETIIPPVENKTLHLAFSDLKEFYKIGDIITVDLIQKVGTNRFERVDLWVAVQLPDGSFLFRTDLGLAPFTSNQQSFKKSLDNIDTTERILADFTVSPGMGGDYVFYAAYVDEGANPVENGLAIKSIISQKITLAN